MSVSFKGMLPERTPTVAVAQKPMPQPASSVSLPVHLGQNQAGFTTLKGTNITIRTLSKPLSETLLTTGTNGTTAILADQIRAVADQLQLAGELTPEQYNSLIALANQGHRLGSIMGLMEQAAASARNNDEFDDTRVFFEGRYTTIEKLEDGLGYDRAGYGEMPTDPLSMSWEPDKDIKSFIKAYQLAANNGALADPLTKSIIQELASEIAMITAAMDNAQWASSEGDIQPVTLLDSVASSITHTDSAGICVTGKAQDSGIQCSG